MRWNQMTVMSCVGGVGLYGGLEVGLVGISSLFPTPTTHQTLNHLPSPSTSLITKPSLDFWDLRDRRCVLCWFWWGLGGSGLGMESIGCGDM